MPQTVTLELTDDQVYSVNQLLATRNVQEPHPTTGALTVRPEFPDGIEGFIQHQVMQLIASITRQYPNPANLARMEQIRALTKEIEDSSKPALKKGTE